MEQQRRTAALSKSYEVCFDETMIVPISQEKFLSNRSNKTKFIYMLVEKLKTIDITTKQARDDADVLIIETAIALSEHQKTAVIIGEDIDLLVILIGRTQSHQQEIFSSKSFDQYPRTKKHILFLHAFSGCDTTSALFKKGKKTVTKALEKIPNLDKLVEVFQQENCPVQTLFENGVRILLALYNAPKSEDNIDHFRYTQFIKLTKLNKPVQLSTLPPTSVAAHQHINRVYYQIQTWLGNDLEPQEWGWMLENGILEPIRTLLPPAPTELLNIIFCNCKNGCGSRCGCRKSGLLCSLACGQCNGQACLNAAQYPSNPDEENAYDPDILEGLEMNMTDNEDDDNELNVFERQ
ncbi:hypothetical protein WA026_016247 [Henosepilachna vigintioctopunctata]|uniref:Tesmin/TSO1-like CXC domain-containing protein n=1 Tax=Henosepilachna vigintioctopunctata TaxID=420089 RepID=A0AAW1TUV0_9CUCU